MRKAKIEVDIVGQIRLFRTATFPSKYPIIKEAIQNGQRSKGVTQMEFWVKPDKIVIMDNGSGLADPRDLLTIAKSGWDEETKREQNPFGLGFFSCVKSADIITIESNNLKMTLDIPKILENGDVTIDVEELEESVQGFRLTLSQPVNEFDLWDLEREIKGVAQYVTKFETIVNGEVIESRDYKKPDQSKFAKEFSNDIYTGWLRPYSYNDMNSEFRLDGLKVFYQDRKVKQYSSLDIAGCIGVNNHKINLRAPDREDFIRDNLYDQMNDRIEEDFKEVMIDILHRASDKELSKYEHIIDKRMKPYEYAKYMKYTIIRDLNKFSKLAETEPEELKNMSSDQIMEIIQEDPKEEPMKDIEINGISTTITPNQIPKVDNPDQPSRQGDKLPDMGDYSMMYYVRKDSIPDYIAILKKALENDIPIVIIKNRLEEEAVKLREDILHVSELTQTTQIRAKIKSAGTIDLKEKRAKILFQLISKVMNLEKNPFVIGDIEATRAVKFGPVEIETKEIKPFGLEVNREQIIIDRSKLQKDLLSESLIKRILPTDLQFIAINLDTIAHELTHLIYDTDDDTAAHFKLQLEVTDQILKKLFSPNFNFKDI